MQKDTYFAFFLKIFSQNVCNTSKMTYLCGRNKAKRKLNNGLYDILTHVFTLIYNYVKYT